jgi:DHA3 family macrolide efflux protein-like MFS transporter
MTILNNSIWRDRNFILYFFGTLISKLGDKIYIIAIPWLVYELTQSSLGMGTMFLVQTLPFIFISPVAGVLADRFSRRGLLIFSAFFQAVFISIIPILHFLHILEVWHIYVLGFLVASGGACFSVVNGTIIPQLFNKEKLIKVNSTFQFLDTSTVLFGSALAGILISKIGVFTVLLLDALSFFPIIISILFLAFKHEKLEGRIQSKSLEQFREGVQYLIKHPALGPLTLLTLMANVANAALISMLVYFARDKLFLSSEQIGWVYAGAAATQMISILLVPFFSKKGTPIRLMLINLMISSIGIIWISFSWDWITLLIGVAVQSAPVIMFNVFNRTLRQKVVPAHIYGRVNGIIAMLGLGTLPLSGFVTGLLADLLDIRYIFFTLALGSFIVGLKFWLSPLKNYSEEKESFKSDVPDTIIVNS